MSDFAAILRHMADNVDKGLLPRTGLQLNSMGSWIDFDDSHWDCTLYDDCEIAMLKNGCVHLTE